MKRTIIEGKFQCKKGDFGFVIPENRADWGGDFFVHKNNFAGAVDNDKVSAEVMDRASGKKPEAKILEVISLVPKKPKKEILETVEGIFSSGSGDFGFVDVPGREEGFFCFGLKKNGAKHGDSVRAEIKRYNGKQEAIVIEILGESGEIFSGVYSDNKSFGFVKIGSGNPDIFIPGGKSMEAKTGEKVEVRVIKTGGRRPEGVVEKIL